MAKPRDFSKKEAQKLHALKRLKQRHGVEESGQFLGQIVGKIQNGDCELLEKQSNRLYLFRVEMNGNDHFVIFDKNRKSIVTFLTREMVNNRVEKEKESNKKDLTIFTKEAK